MTRLTIVFSASCRRVIGRIAWGAMLALALGYAAPGEAACVGCPCDPAPVRNYWTLPWATLNTTSVSISVICYNCEMDSWPPDIGASGIDGNDYAAALGLQVLNAGDTDYVNRYQWWQDPWNCQCYPVPNSFLFSDPVEVRWHGSVDRTRVGQYVLTAEIYNPGYTLVSLGPSPPCGTAPINTKEASFYNVVVNVMPHCDNLPFNTSSQHLSEHRSKCCGLIVPRPGHVTDENGCSSPGQDYMEIVVPDPNAMACGGATFKGACDAHDGCYDNCIDTKGECDEAFLLDLYDACENDMPAGLCTVTCRAVAWSYYYAVKEGGWIAWIAAQRSACICCCD